MVGNGSSVGGSGVGAIVGTTSTVGSLVGSVVGSLVGGTTVESTGATSVGSAGTAVFSIGVATFPCSGVASSVAVAVGSGAPLRTAGMMNVVEVDALAALLAENIAVKSHVPMFWAVIVTDMERLDVPFMSLPS